MFRKYICLFVSVLFVVVNANESLNAGNVNNLVPVAPVATWSSALSPLNVPDNQTITVNRPNSNPPVDSPPAAVSYWRVVYTDRITEEIATSDFFAATRDAVILVAPLKNIRDNRDYEIRAHWVSYRNASATYFYGINSDPTTVRVGDRTPPKVTSHSPANNVTNVPLNTPIVINWTDEDIEQIGVSKNLSVIKINNVDMASSGTNNITAKNGKYVTGNWTYAPAGQKYNETVSVSVQLFDNAGNFMTTQNFSYKTTFPAPAAAPTVTWLPTAANGGNTQKFTVSSPIPNIDGITIDNIDRLGTQWFLLPVFASVPLHVTTPYIA